MHTLVLAGVIVGIFFSSAITVLISIVDFDRLGGVIHWLLGNLAPLPPPALGLFALGGLRVAFEDRQGILIPGLVERVPVEDLALGQLRLADLADLGDGRALLVADRALLHALVPVLLAEPLQGQLQGALGLFL